MSGCCFSAKLGVAPSTLNRILSGRGRVSASMAQRLASEL
ncbi:helix-turn-helix domain-containing protein [Duganella vulcania]